MDMVGPCPFLNIWMEFLEKIPFVIDMVRNPKKYVLK